MPFGHGRRHAFPIVGGPKHPSDLRQDDDRDKHSVARGVLEERALGFFVCGIVADEAADDDVGIKGDHDGPPVRPRRFVREPAGYGRAMVKTGDCQTSSVASVPSGFSTVT
jgi:hypothetical protein